MDTIYDHAADGVATCNGGDYESETAFRTAFSRRMLCTPMQYRRRMAALLLHRTLR